MQGKIIRGIGGFYYVQTESLGVLECKAKGIFRNLNVKPLVGDDVEVSVLSEKEKLGNIDQILPRENQLLRPAVANVDQAVVIFASSYPKPNLNLLDRFLLMMETQQVPTCICFSKSDESDSSFLEELAWNYAKSESDVFFTSIVTGQGVEAFRKCLLGKTSVLAGPSGVGKSSMMNEIFPEANLAIGEISEKIKRGKHTTRHSELFYLGDDTYVMDTPGFTSLRLPELEKEELREYYPEFSEYRDSCRFLGCVHVSEPDCRVKLAVEQGEISKGRYENYKQFYEELKERKKY